MAPRHTSTANKRKTNSSKTQNQSVGNKIIYRHHTFLLGWKFWLSKCGRWPGVGLSLILFNFYQKDDSVKRFDVILASCCECFCFLLRHKSFQFKCSQLVDKSHYYIHFLHLWPPSPEDGPSWCKQRPTAKSTSATSALFSDTSAPKTSSLGVGCGKAAGNCLNCARFRHPCPLF